MKSATFCLFIFISLLLLMVPVHTRESTNSLLEKKIKELLNYQDGCPSAVTQTLSCTSVKAMGTLASCPAGMVATGCSCGFACGSWNIQNENVCHCLCPIIDWTVARCCHLA